MEASLVLVVADVDPVVTPEDEAKEYHNVSQLRGLYFV